MNKRTRQEYGGFLPLELNPGKEWFDGHKGNLRRFNSIKAAIVYAVCSIGMQEIYVPYYYCPSTTEAIKKTGINVKFYHIDHLLHPVDLPDTAGTAVLIVNYFGVLDSYVAEKVKEITSASVFIDNAHAFFCKPVIRQNIYNFYSAKKFVGVPDGAYLIGEDIPAYNGECEYAADYSHFLLLAYEQGTNAAYDEKKETDLFIGSHYGAMSKLARGILQNVDYFRVMKARKDNFEVFQNVLQKSNLLRIKESVPAYLFPFLTKNGNKIKKALVEEKIFVPTLWAGEDLLANGNEFELQMSSDAVFLPVDQRYDLEDILFMADVVEELCDENTNIGHNN